MAKSKKHVGFIDLGDSLMGELRPTSKKGKPKKWYPTLNLRKPMLKKGIGQSGTALVKFKVTGIRMRDDEAPEFTLDLEAIKEQTGNDNGTNE